MFVFHGRVPVHIFVFMALLPWSSTAIAQQRVPLTLAEAEDIALADEPGHRALLARADAFQQQAVSAGQLPDPLLRVGLENYPTDGGGFSAEGMTQAKLGIRQAFPRGRVRELGSEHMRARADAFDSSADARLREVRTSVRNTWLDAYFAQQAWSLVNESRPFFADLVIITRSMYAVGRKSQHDVLRAELELSRLDDRLIEADRARSEAQADLSRWLGQDAHRPIAMKLPDWAVPPQLPVLKDGLATHPILVAASAGVSAQQAAVDMAEEEKKPGWALDLGYGYREGYQPDGQPRSDFVSLAITVDLPFFGKNRQDRKLAAALSERSAAQYSRTALKAQLQGELEAEYARWLDLTRRLELYESRILQQSKGQAQSALLAYQSDTADFSDVMRGSIDDLNTRLEYIRLQVERAQSYAVLANLGGLDK